MSLLTLFGGGSSEESPQSGVRGLLARWVGGAGTSTTQAGFRSLLARWVGGASAQPSTAQGGVRSLLAFWAGGATTAVAPDTDPPPPPGNGGFIGGGFVGFSEKYLRYEPKTFECNPTGGLAFGGAAAVRFTGSYKVAGSSVFSGSAAVSFARSFQPYGGTEFTGSCMVAKSFSHQATTRNAGFEGAAVCKFKSNRDAIDMEIIEGIVSALFM